MTEYVIEVLNRDNNEWYVCNGGIYSLMTARQFLALKRNDYPKCKLRIKKIITTQIAEVVE